jgi:sugar/nucleoside kinase (ribokinase family)
VDLITFGTVFLEIVFGHVPALPGPGEEIFADEFAVSCGGAVTAASAASRLGVHASLCTTLGDDLGSRVVEEHCRHAQVDLSTSRYVTGRSAGITVVVNFDDDRAFISYLPPRPPTETCETQRWLETLQRHRPTWCYLHAGPGRADLLAQARSLGIRIALDVGLNEIASDPEAVISCVRLSDVFLPNADELRKLTRAGSLDAAISTAVSWARCLVVKRGGEGAIAADRGSRTDVTEGLLPVKVRDRTGAGDAFAGALVGALCQGASMAEAAAAGNAAGSDTVSRLGAVGEVEVEGLSVAAPAVAAALLRCAPREPADSSEPAAAAGASGRTSQKTGEPER